MTGGPSKPRGVMETLLEWAKTQEPPQRPASAPPPARPGPSPQPDIPEPAYRILMKAGPLRNGAERGHGSVWHAVVARPESGAEALCGARPKIMWSSWSPPHAEITCARCRKLAARLAPPEPAEEPSAPTP